MKEPGRIHHIATQREIDAFEQKRREATTNGCVLRVSAIRHEDVHPIHERLALVAIAATYI